MLRRILIPLLMLGMVPLTATPSANGNLGLGRFIVVLDNPADAAAVAGAAVEHGAKVNATFGSALNGFVATLPLLNLGALRSDPRVAYVKADRPVRLLAETPTGTPTGVSRIGALPEKVVQRANTPRAAVAILDTGAAPHPDLNVVGGVDCANDLLGNLLGGGGFKDNNGHGTHVSGTVGAKADGSGVVGVAPGAPIYAVRVFGQLGAGTMAGVICGMEWVAENAAQYNIKVVNMSLGGSGIDDGACGATSQDPFHQAICNVVAKGVTVVVAAGNDGVDLSGTVPAAYDEVLTVSAIADFDGQPGGTGAPTTCGKSEKDDTPASFSNFALVNGPDANHTISAPGTCITSTWLSGGYNTISGTSMASPHVAGAVARCIDAGPCAGLTPAQIIAKMRSDAAARPAGSGFFGDPGQPAQNRYYGYLLNAAY
jgi:subtilisin family serine protease